MTRPSALPSQIPSPRGTPETAASLLAWVANASLLAPQRAVPELILKLESLLADPMHTETRFMMLHALKGAVLRVAAVLPKGRPATGVRNLEQRLYDAMARNCKRLLRDLDRQRRDRSADQAWRRSWAMRNGMRFLGRQIFEAVKLGQPWPRGLWQDLHDLYVYQAMRGACGETEAGGGARRAFDPQQAYKHLLLVGLVSELMDRQPLGSAVLERLEAIAAQSRLVEPHACLGEYGLTLVDAGCDRPPRLWADRLGASLRGWVLQTPAELDALLLDLDRFRQSGSGEAA